MPGSETWGKNCKIQLDSRFDSRTIQQVIIWSESKSVVRIEWWDVFLWLRSNYCHQKNWALTVIRVHGRQYKWILVCDRLMSESNTWSLSVIILYQKVQPDSWVWSLHIRQWKQILESDPFMSDSITWFLIVINSYQIVNRIPECKMYISDN